MFENEIKAFVLEPEKAVEYLQDSGWEREEISYRDTYFLHPCREFDRGEELRLREKGGKTILTYKRGAGESRLEIETEVGPEIRRILEELGFRELLWKEKRGYRFRKGEMEVVIVHVRGGRGGKKADLGWFIEAEILTELPDEKSVEKLRRLLEKIPGIGPIDKKFYAERILEALGEG